MGIVNDFISDSRFSTLPAGMSASGSFYDKKNFISFSTDIKLPSSEYSVTEYSVDIDNLYQSAANNGVHKVVDILDLLKNNSTLTQTTIKKNSGDIPYPFVNNQNYRVLYEIYVNKKENGVVVDSYKLFHIQEFRYYEDSVSLSDFTFDDNVQVGDQIKVSGLNLVHSSNTNPIDLTVPETMEFKFQEAELVASSNKQPTERYIARLPYHPSGIYVLPPNSLTNGKVYKVDVEAQWELGYVANQRCSVNLYILNRPKIATAGVEVKGLSVHDPENVVVSINMDALVPSGANAIPSKIWFEFYDYNNLHANVNGNVVLTSKSNVIADSKNIIQQLLEGWRVINTAVGTNGAAANALPKVNLYYYGNSVPAARQNSSNSFTVNQIDGMGTYAIINQHQGSKEYPFVIAYTTPTASGNKASWYKSKLFYAPQSSGDTVADSSKIGLTLLYTGTDDSSFRPDIPSSRRVQLALLPHDGTLTNANSTYATEIVNLVSLHTSSNASTSQAGNFNFTLSEAGLETSSSVLTSFSMNFTSSILVARTGGDPQASDANGNPTSGINISGDLYSLKLNQIDIISGGGILNDNQYGVKALVRYPGPHYRSSDAVNVTFDLVRPSIARITPYDVQVDGGNDGVFHPSSTDVDTSDQIIATVEVDNVAYELYAPSEIRFNIYNLTGTQLARASERLFKNSLSFGTQSYNIKLNELTLLDGAEALTNGTPYRVTAEVKLLDHDSNPTPEWRESSSFTSVQFHQNVSPVSSVTISNTWALATDNNPSSSEERFNASPLVGVSGYFMKTAQFGSGYSKHLDVATTRFRIEYSINNGVSWPVATRAALGKRSSGESMAAAAERVARVSSLVSRPDGQYANVVGSGLGTSQEEMVFYIPQDQGVGNTIAFTENNHVHVRVTVVAAAGLWVSGVSDSTPTLATPSPLQVINKISSYNPAALAEPWNSDTDDLLHLNVDGGMATTLKSKVRADSNNIIEELDQGWRVVNTRVGTNGASATALPKVNLYYYANDVPAAQQDSSNSFAVNEMNGMGTYVVINQNAGSKEYPFIIAYTTPTASGNKASWYKSKLFYAPQSSGDTTDTSKVGLTLLYTGTDNLAFRTDIPSGRRVKCALLPHDGALTNANATYATELVNLVSLQTSSNASTSQSGNFNFTLSEAGLNTSSLVFSSRVMSFAKKLYVEKNDAMVVSNVSDVRADSNNIITYLPEGWKVVNTDINTGGASGGKLPKVNLYYYANAVPAAQQNSSNSFAVNQMNGMGACVVINQNAGSKEYPFFIAYTTPTASGNKASWYKSKLFYAPQSSGDTVADSSKVGVTLLYTGTDNLAFRKDIPSSRRVKCALLPHDGALTNANATYATELVNLVSLHTSSNASTSQAGNFNFTLSEAGLNTSSSVLSSFSMKFAKNLLLNIPINHDSVHAHSVKVSYKYAAGHTYVDRTFNSPTSLVSLFVDPNQGTTLHYSVAYIVNNQNLTSEPKTTQGLTVSTSVPNKYFPVSSDYTVTNPAYNTFNDTPSKSSISFKLVLNADSRNRLDGVNLYFTSPSVGTGEGKNGSNIKKVRIGTYKVDFENSVTLLNASGQNLLVIDAVAQGTNLSWGNYDMANISFEAFRDARVNSANAPYKSLSSTSDPVSSDFYVESGTQSTFGTPDRNPIWNVPVLTRPSADASGDNIYELSGGVINIVNTSNHVITWPTAKDANLVDFTYDLEFLKNGAIIVPSNGNSYENQGGNSYVIPIDLNNVAKYTIKVRKVFNGLLNNERKLSQPDILEFYSSKVETSGMNLSVTNPSDTSSVTLSWGAPVITGESITASGSESASIANNIHLQHVDYRTTLDGTTFSNFSRLLLDASGNPLTRAALPLIEGPAPKTYTLPNTNLGTLYEFIMYIEAQVRYTLNGAVQETKSVPHGVPYTPQVPTPQSQYRVSTIPSIVLPHNAPVLVQGWDNPTLLLNLNARGLEYEGFVSVVVILTQDGTPAKPEGEQALLVFPNPNSSNPFSLNNNVTGASGVAVNDPRLAGGESSTSSPINAPLHNPWNATILDLSTQNNNYTLTIGAKGSDGRYGLSQLKMPSSDESGFQESGAVGSENYNPVNYMVILTTRRGTDIAVGQFTYQRTPVVRDVQIVNENGEYKVKFNISST
jgi:hypothetical protein